LKYNHFELVKKIYKNFGKEQVHNIRGSLYYTIAAGNECVDILRWLEQNNFYKAVL
jgi:hypothetical protein